METRLSPSKLDGRKTLAAVLIVFGLAVIATSFVWPGKSSRRGAWSDEQARRYQATSSKLHALSHEIAHAKPADEESVRSELKKAQADFEVLRGQLESAQSRPQRLAWLLRIAGLACVLVGGGLLFLLPANDNEYD